LIKSYENLERFDISKSYFSWLYAIGVNLARDYLRKSGREARLFGCNFDECNTIVECSNQQMQLEQKLEVAKVVRAMEGLSFDHREALILRFREELSMKEIAVALSISVSGAKMRVHRALKELRTILQRDIFC
jgi:RNA polymerase sigma-70 factor (ECF subfamily)